MAGYSGTPLAKKLCIKENACVVAIDPPQAYYALLQPLPSSVRFADAFDGTTDIVHLFVKDRAALATSLALYRKTLAHDATVWVSWPKKASKLPTDITEDVIREVALPLGFVDVKVCAIDEVGRA